MIENKDIDDIDIDKLALPNQYFLWSLIVLKA